METIKFHWERARERKLYTLLVLFAILLILLPDGFTDFFTLVPIIAFLGLKLYLLTLTILILITTTLIFQSRLVHQPTIREAIRVCDKITKTKTQFRKCVKKHG